MATFTVNENDVHGKMRVKVGVWTASGTAESIDIGSKIYHVQVAKQSATTMPNAQINKGVSGTSIIGTLAMTSTAANDVYNVIVFTAA